MQVQATQLGHDPVRDAAWQPSSEPSILPLKTPTADDVISLAQFRNEGWDLGRIMLKIAIHRDDDVSSSRIETGLKTGGLAEVLTKPHNRNARIVIAYFRQDFEGVVAAAIVDKNDFIVAAQLRHCCNNPGVERTDVTFFVIKRNNDGVSNLVCDFHIPAPALCS